MSSFPSLLTLLLIIGNVLGVWMLIPQAQKLSQTKRLAGVSPRWLGLGFGSNAGWLAYAILADLPAIIPVSAGALVLYTWMLITLAGIPEAGIGEALATIAVLLTALAATAAIGGVTALGVFGLGFLYVVLFAPAAWESATSNDLSGIAPMTWVMGLAEAAIWTLYAVSTSDIGLFIGGAGASTMSIVVLVNLYRKKPAPKQARLQTSATISSFTRE